MLRITNETKGLSTAPLTPNPPRCPTPGGADARALGLHSGGDARGRSHSKLGSGSTFPSEKERKMLWKSLVRFWPLLGPRKASRSDLRWFGIAKVGILHVVWRASVRTV